MIFKFLPHKYFRIGVKGRVILKCRVLPTTYVSDCSIVSYTQPSGDLGAATLKLATLFRIKPRTVRDTLSDNAWVLIPMTFNVVFKLDWQTF
jgi:TonB family protein